jgi:hypothetical protein
MIPAASADRRATGFALAFTMSVIGNGIDSQLTSAWEGSAYT